VKQGTIKNTKLPGEANMDTKNARKQFGGRGSTPDPAGEHTAPQAPLASSESSNPNQLGLIIGLIMLAG